MRRSFKKTIAILLAVVLAFSVMTVGVVGVSAADGEMKVTVSSTVPEFFRTSTQYVAKNADKLTVTYWFNLEDYSMVNNQWQMIYNPSVLQYDTDDGVNQTVSNNKTTYLIYKFPDKENGSMQFNPVCEREGVMKGNITNANGFECYGQKYPFLSITFKIIDHNASETSVNLDMQVMQVRHKDISQSITPVDFINHSEIVNNDVLFTTDESYTAAYEGEYDAHYGETPEHLDNFWIGGYNLSLRSNIAMQVFVEDTKIAEYDSFWVTATAEGKGTTVLQPHHTIGSGTTLKHVFLYNKIYANEMYKNVSFEVHATKNGVEYYGDACAWSIKKYIYDDLSKEDIDSKPAYKTLLVDLLNYGAAAQTYTNSTEPLVNADLTSTQQACATEEPTCVDNSGYSNVLQNYTASWNSVKCVLGSSIAVKLTFTDLTGKGKEYVTKAMNATLEAELDPDASKKENLYTENVKDGVKLSTYYTPVLDKSGKAVAIFAASYSNDKIGKTIFGLIGGLIGLSLGVMLVSVIIFFFSIRRHIIKPVTKLTESVRTMEESVKNRQPVTTDIRTGDEIEELAVSFEDMNKDLIGYIDENERITAEKQRIDTELSLATGIQAGMLPDKFPAFPDRKDFDIYASMKPAKEVGGDFYDFFLIDENRLGIVMADVSGKGVPAALFMMHSKILLKSYTLMKQTPKAALEEVNRQICEHNPEEMFVTVWLGVLDLKTGLFTAANAGHEKPAVKQAGGSFELLMDKHGIMVGYMDGIRFKEYELQLTKGSKLFLYTDGVAEATNANEELFGTDRMIDALRTAEDGSPKEILAAVNAAVDEFVGDAPQFDDLTMLCIEYNGDPEE